MRFWNVFRSVLKYTKTDIMKDKAALIKAGKLKPRERGATGLSRRTPSRHILTLTYTMTFLLSYNRRGVRLKEAVSRYDRQLKCV